MSLLTKEEAESIEIPGPAWGVMCRLNDENKALKNALGDALRRADRGEATSDTYKACWEAMLCFAKGRISCPLCESEVEITSLRFAIEHFGRESTRKAAIEELGATEETMLHDLIHVPMDW